MTIRHRVKDSDTVEYLAQLYYGTPDKWRDIVDYNNLVYPYLSKNQEDRYRSYAGGFLRVTRDVSRQPLTIKKYWTVKTRKNVLSATVKTFYITDDVTIPAGETEGYIPVRSSIPGIQGNAPEGTVTELGEDFALNSVLVEVTNDSPLAGGIEGYVRTTGEYLYIPNAEDAATQVDHGSTFGYDQLRYFFGEDLKTDTFDDLCLVRGDLETVGFLDNLTQSINRLFVSERGDVLSDYSFGNEISRLIGDNSMNFEAKRRLVEIEVIRCLNEESRVTDPVVEKVELIPSALACIITVSMRVEKLGEVLRMENIRIGGISNV